MDTNEKDFGKKFPSEKKPEGTYQEFLVLVQVSGNSITEIRSKLDAAVEHLKEVKEVVDVALSTPDE